MTIDYNTKQRRILFMIFVVFSIIITTTHTMMQYYVAKHTARETIVDKSVNKFKERSAISAEFFDHIKDGMILISSTQKFKKLKEIGDFNTLDKFLIPFVIAHHNIASLSFVDNNGVEKFLLTRDEHASMPRMEEPSTDIKIPEYHDYDNLLFTEIKNNSKGKQVISVELSQKNSFGFAGILKAEYFLDEFFKKLSNSTLYDIIIYNDKGIVYYAPNGETLLSDIYPEYTAEILTDITYRNDSLHSFRTKLNLIGGYNMILAVKESYLELQSKKAIIQYVYISVAVIGISFILITFMHLIFDRAAEKLHEVEDEKKNLLKRQEKYEKEIITDEFTGLYNRKYYNDRIAEHISQVKRYNSSFALALIDIDNLKQINDIYGHSMGDTIIAKVAEIVMQNTRESDICCRYSGDELAIIFPVTGGVEHCVEKIRDIVSKTEFNYDITSFNVTISAGIAISDSGDTQNTIFSRADNYLYAAKQSGRNTVKF